MSENQREDTGGPERERTDDDWERQARGVAGRAWQRLGGGLPPYTRDDCVCEALVALLLAHPRMAGLALEAQASYAEAVMGNAVRRFLGREQDERRLCAPLDAMHTDDGEPLEWPSTADTEAEALRRLDLPEQIGNETLASAVKALAAADRAILCLHYLEQRSDEETAAILGMSTDAVWRKRACVTRGLRDVMKRTKLTMEQHS